MTELTPREKPAGKPSVTRKIGSPVRINKPTFGNVTSVSY